MGRREGHRLSSCQGVEGKGVLVSKLSPREVFITKSGRDRLTAAKYGRRRLKAAK